MKISLSFTVPLLTLLSSACGGEVPLSVDKQHSRIEYAVTATMDSFSGKLDAYDLAIANDATAVGNISRAELRFHFADLHSDSARRDQQMQAWENTREFPDCIFTLSMLEPTPIPGRFIARGRFALHGITRDLAFPLSIASGEDGLLVVNGEARIDTRDFGLPIIRKFGLLKVDPLVVVKLHVQARGPAGK